MGKVIGVAMIVKNEEAVLGRCLESVKTADQIVICDTGSTDRTIEIAKQYTDKIFTDFTWNDRFCDARNHAKSKSTAEWILSIDADEQLTCDFQNVRQAVEQAFLAVDCKMYAEDNNQFHYFPRLFKNSPQVWWVGAVHNHLSVLGEKVGDVRITYGYSPAHFGDKDRAMRILEREVNGRPDAQREMFYLGREYYYRRRYEDAVVMFGRYVQQSRYLAEKAEAFLIMARCYWEMRMADDARDACVQALIINSNFAEASRFMAMLAGEGTGNPRFEGNAAQWNRMAATANNHDVLFVRESQKPRSATPPKILPSEISCCLITKEATYPKEILAQIQSIGFGEILILTNCDSPHRKQELFQKAKYNYIFYQDDDCIAPISELLEHTEFNQIVCAMKSGHLKQYASSRIALLGWGSIFPKSAIEVLDFYREKYGEDDLYKRETERILTYLHFPQKRLDLPIIDLPSAMAPDRLSFQPGHYDYIPQVEERCARIIAEMNTKNAEIAASVEP